MNAVGGGTEEKIPVPRQEIKKVDSCTTDCSSSLQQLATSLGKVLVEELGELLILLPPPPTSHHQELSYKRKENWENKAFLLEWDPIFSFFSIGIRERDTNLARISHTPFKILSYVRWAEKKESYVSFRWRKRKVRSCSLLERFVASTTWHDGQFR